MTSALIMLTPANVHAFVGYWFRVLLPNDRRLLGVVAGVDSDGKTIITEQCPLSKIDIDDLTVWVENDQISPSTALLNTPSTNNGCAE